MNNDETCNGALPYGLTLEYLRRVAHVHPRWRVRLVWRGIPEPAALACIGDDATVVLSTQYHFTSEALIRTVLHELFELSSIETWNIFLSAVSVHPERELLIQRYRHVRDEEIARKLSLLTWFSIWDVPLKKEALGG